MKRIIYAALASMLLFASTSANAALLFSVYGEAQHWMAEAEGGFGDFVFQQEFDFEDDNGQRLSIALDHPLPLIPNVRLESQSLSTSGVGVADGDFQFAQQLYRDGSDLSSDLDLSHNSLTLYYRFLDNSLVRLHAGVTAKMFDGFATMRVESGNEVGATSTRVIDETVPLVYVNASVGLPFSGLSLYVRGHALALDDNSIQDLEGGIQYRVLNLGVVDASIQAGYRTFSMELDDFSSLYSDLDFTGPFLGFQLHF